MCCTGGFSADGSGGGAASAPATADSSVSARTRSACRFSPILSKMARSWLRTVLRLTSRSSAASARLSPSRRRPASRSSAGVSPKLSLMPLHSRSAGSGEGKTSAKAPGSPLAGPSSRTLGGTTKAKAGAEPELRSSRRMACRPDRRVSDSAASRASALAGSEKVRGRPCCATAISGSRAARAAGVQARTRRREDSSSQPSSVRAPAASDGPSPGRRTICARPWMRPSSAATCSGGASPPAGSSASISCSQLSGSAAT